MIRATLRRTGGLRAANGALVGLTPIGVREGVLVEASDDHGHVGFGEASPLAGFHAATSDEVEARLEDAVAMLAGLEEVTVEAIRDLAARSAAPAICRFALETALLHLLAGRGGVVPTGVSALFDGLRDAIPVAGFGGALRGPEVLARVRALTSRGIQTIKFKTDGADLRAERAALDAIRATLDAPVALRLDLNGALDADRARAALDAYADAGVEVVEEPCGAAELSTLGEAAMGWFADESLQDAEIASAVLEHPGCAGVVLKPALLGFFGARALALRAIERDKRVVVTHMFDGPVALAAACELALSLPRAPLACGLDLHGGLHAYPQVAIPQHRGRFIQAVDAP